MLRNTHQVVKTPFWAKCWNMTLKRTSGLKSANLTLSATATPWVSCPRRQLTTVASKFVHPIVGVGLKKIRKIKTKQKSHHHGLDNVKDLLSFVCICVHLILCMGSDEALTVGHYSEQRIVIQGHLEHLEHSLNTQLGVSNVIVILHIHRQSGDSA